MSQTPASGTDEVQAWVTDGRTVSDSLYDRSSASVLRLHEDSNCCCKLSERQIDFSRRTCICEVEGSPRERRYQHEAAVNLCSMRTAIKQTRLNRRRCCYAASWVSWRVVCGPAHARCVSVSCPVVASATTSGVEYHCLSRFTQSHTRWVTALRTEARVDTSSRNKSQRQR